MLTRPAKTRGNLSLRTALGAPAMQGVQFATFDFTPFQAVVYIHRASWFEAYQSKVPRCHLGLLR